MANLNINIPVLNVNQKVLIELKVNCQKKLFRYVLEVFDWNKCDNAQSKADCLKKMINQYDPEWQVFQIGEATDKNISVMFKEKN